jgi:hypothetical protein
MLSSHWSFSLANVKCSGIDDEFQEQATYLRNSTQETFHQD